MNNLSTKSVDTIRTAANISRHLIAITLLLSCMLLTPQLASATEEYAGQTGQACAVCHLDPGGGGELTPPGKVFAATFHKGAEVPSSGLSARLFRLMIGYLHILTAIFWFGTILYVHLILKPAYAAGGLPRGEVRVGLISMIIMGITGAVMTFYRITSLDMLLHTRFGILLLTKIALYLVMVLSALFVITVIGPRLKAKRKGAGLADVTAGVTLEELASYDGKGGRPTWFAYEGKVYDATWSKLWKQGTHMGRHNAGNDLTEALKQAPHGMEKLSAMSAVGDLIASGPLKAPLQLRVFFFMAHMNLAIVFMIVLILSLWRWW